MTAVSATIIESQAEETDATEEIVEETNDNSTATPTTGTATATDDVEDRALRLYRGELLAPMVRASTTPLRTLAIKYGANAVYTEELIDRSITGTIRIENDQLGTIDYVRDISNASQKTIRKYQKEQPGGGPPLLLRIDPKKECNKLICQIGSGESVLALPAALHVQKDVYGIDLNMGCPKKFSVSGGMGSALLDDVDRACSILRTWKDHIPNKPISAKIRLLSNHTTIGKKKYHHHNNNQNNSSSSSSTSTTATTPVSISKTLDFIRGIVERGGIHALAIHGRTVGHDSTISANWDALEEIVIQTKMKYPNLSILINGDFYTRSEFMKFQNKTKCNGILLGRPALYNTSIFQKPTTTTTTPIITTTTTNGTKQQQQEEEQLYGYNSPLLLNKTNVIQEYINEAMRYDIHYKNVKYVICEMMNNRRAPSNRVPYLLQEYIGQQTIAKVCSCSNMLQICQLWNINSSHTTTTTTARTTNATTTTMEQQHHHQQHNNNKKNQQSSSSSSIQSIAAPAGEHKYDDEYILQRMGSDTNPTTTSSSSTTSTTATSNNITSSSSSTTLLSSSSSSMTLPPNKRTRVS